MYKFFARVSLVCCVAGIVTLLVGRSPHDWVGDRQYRILVRIDPSDLRGRPRDEMPARLKIDADLKKTLGIADRRIDVASIEVCRYDPKARTPIPYHTWAYAKADWDLPYRWYDAAIPDDYPEAMNVN